MAGRSGRGPKAPASVSVATSLDNAHLASLTEFLTAADWFTKPRLPGRFQPGTLTTQPLTVPQRDAQVALREVVRLVADLPLGTSPIVVWEHEGSELLIDTGSIALVCGDALVSVSVAVSCDQVPERTRITVPFGVGTPDAPSGLVMSTLRALDGPDLVTSRWSEALTAFSWESLVELSRRLCEQLGHDAAGLPLVPGSISSVLVRAT